MNASRFRRRAVLGAALLGLSVAALAAAWSLNLVAGSPPSDSSSDSSTARQAAVDSAPQLSPDAVVDAGREQFTRVRQTEPADSKLAAHRMFNARSCAECHRLSGIGGGGPNENNVQLLNLTLARAEPRLTEAFGEARGPVVLHRRSSAPEYAAWRLSIFRRYLPKDPEAVAAAGAGPKVPPAEFLVEKEERNTPPLFGLGLLESIADSEIIAVALAQPERIRGRFPRLKEGGRGRFGWKSGRASLLAFNENACAVELGLTTPNFTPATFPPAELARDLRPATEGKIVTPSATDMSQAEVAALTRFVANLPAPRQVIEPARRLEVAEGARLFEAIGCATCHMPNLGGATGVYSDLLLHSVGSSGGGYYGESPGGRSPDFDLVRADEFRTPPLWGVADSGPYFHDGSAATINAAIVRHTNQANEIAATYRSVLKEHQRQSIVAFLETLRAP